jgi:SRSO17 transposase
MLRMMQINSYAAIPYSQKYRLRHFLTLAYGSIPLMTRMMRNRSHVMHAPLYPRVNPAFQRFYASFAPLFGRIEIRRRSAQYMHSLLVQRMERRNAENLTEAVGATPRAFQRLLCDSPWSYHRVIDALQAFVGRYLNGDDGTWVLEDIGFSKQGNKSVGVARQRNPTLGTMDNCQVGVFLRYASARGQAVVDTQLYLPQSWINNGPRRQCAGVPDTVTYQFQADLALDMLQAARERRHLDSS